MANIDNIHKVACNISGGSLPDGFKVLLNMEIDYAGVTPAQERIWSASNRVIAVQRPLRTMSTTELNELAKKPYKVRALDCGKKVMSREDNIQAKVAQGMSLEAATLAVDNPEKFNQLMDEMTAKISG